jgi:hypothetical protein
MVFRLQQSTVTKLINERVYRFILGLIVGVSLGSVVIFVFSGSIMSSLVESIFLSFVTYGGFALILGGYFYKKNGQKTFASDFALGMGIGMIMVWFVGAGNGTITTPLD